MFPVCQESCKIYYLAFLKPKCLFVQVWKLMQETFSQNGTNRHVRGSEKLCASHYIFISCLCFALFSCFETGSQLCSSGWPWTPYIAQAGNLRSSSLCFQRTGITGIHHHARLHLCPELSQLLLVVLLIRIPLPHFILQSWCLSSKHLFASFCFSFYHKLVYVSFMAQLLYFHSGSSTFWFEH
jgi:hypothetical protein